MLLLVGTGPMAVEYAKVLNAQNVEFVVVGRGQKSAEQFEKKSAIKPVLGGLDNFIGDISNGIHHFSKAIVAVGVEQLSSCTVLLLKAGIKDILVEKPAGLNAEQITELDSLSSLAGANVFVAYNRRFYSSVENAKQMIEADGGVESFSFEITEWQHVIKSLVKAEGVKDNWFLGNTTHVVDLAFYLGGVPTELSTYSRGALDWHPRSKIFAGAGVTDKDALFSYQGHWSAPGRWNLEFLTSKHRYIFRPMEKLQIQKLGSVAIEFVSIDDALDVEFKPGIYKQTKSFLDQEVECLCKLEEHMIHLSSYTKIAGY